MPPPPAPTQIPRALPTHDVFMLPLPLCAGRASSSEAYATARVVPDSYADKYSKFNPLPPRSRGRRPRGDPAAQTCHSFNADTALGRTSQVYDINGIVSLLCRCVRMHRACHGGILPVCEALQEVWTA